MINSKSLILVSILIIGGVAAGFYYANRDIPPQAAGVIDSPPVTTEPDPSKEMPDTRTFLEVPYTSETPTGSWDAPWNNACEEAAITMVDKYYYGAKTITKTEAKEAMEKLFAVQDRIWNHNANSDAKRMEQLINDHQSFSAKIKENPTLEEIKEEIRSGRPVITLHYGFALGNKNIPFRPDGSSYHTLVVTGFDEATGEFITNDSGDAKEGEGRRYKYEVLVSSLHDYDYKQQKANGPARVLFTDK